MCLETSFKQNEFAALFQAKEVNNHGAMEDHANREMWLLWCHNVDVFRPFTAVDDSINTTTWN